MAHKSISTVKLNNGIDMPMVGLGTWQSPKGAVSRAVQYALQNGYDLVDAAWCYRNEQEVGEGIKNSGRQREDLFITSKLWSTFHTRPQEGLDQTLKDLGLEYLDLYLIHWPVALNPSGTSPIMPLKPDGSRDILEHPTLADTWKEMENLLQSGKLRAIGVCNVSPKWMDELLRTARVVPAVCQIESHPYLPQQEVLDYYQQKGIVVQAYSPLGSTASPILQDNSLLKLADKHGCSVSQICVSYQAARGAASIPKSVSPTRIEENLNIVRLEPEDISHITEIHKEPGKCKRFVAPNWGVDFGFDNWNM